MRTTITNARDRIDHAIPARRIAGVATFTLLTALGAAVSVPLPFTPVPMTLQTLFVLLAGVTLGPRLGLLSMALYLLLGTAGYHVFAGGSWGLTTLFGVTGGYLLGFALAQPVIGTLARRHGGTWRDLLLAALAGKVIVYACGLAWLAVWLNVGWSRALELGFYPFALGGVLKISLAVGVGRWAVPESRRWRIAW
jgi:biotin transport system substrate-specific component